MRHLGMCEDHRRGSWFLGEECQEPPYGGTHPWALDVAMEAVFPQKVVGVLRGYVFEHTTG